MKKAIYWIEYVIRNGPDPIRSPALQFSWWQLALLDVYGFILLFTIVILAVIALFIKVILSKLIAKSCDKSVNKTKTH